MEKITVDYEIKKTENPVILQEYVKRIIRMQKEKKEEA